MGFDKAFQNLNIKCTEQVERIDVVSQLHDHLKLNFQLLAQGHRVIKPLSPSLNQQDLLRLQECARIEYPLLHFDWGQERAGYLFVWIR